MGEAFGARGMLRDPDLPDDVRTFLESVMESFPDLDIHLLAMARREEALRGGPRGAHKNNAGSALTLYLAQAVWFCSL